MDFQNAPLIALVGRPNVGKSTFFNRLTGRWQAIVEDRPGITRDRLYGETTILNHPFRIMDTGGLMQKPKSDVERKMSLQAERGLEEADLILFVMDGREGLLPEDEDWIRKLRKIKTPKIYLVNKLDLPSLDKNLSLFEGLGLSPLVGLSSETQRGFHDLAAAIFKTLNLSADLPEDKDDILEFGSLEDEENQDDGEMKIIRPPRLAIIGRPNVGKSTLLNALVGDERSIVDNVPGTTRDPIHSWVINDGEKFEFIDTAGIRKRAKSTERVEKFSVVHSLNTIEKSDIVLFLIDAEEGPTEQDAHVAGEAFERGKAIIIVANKWDEGAKKFTREAFKERLELKMNYLNVFPLIFISAKTRKNLDKLWRAVATVRDQYEKRIKTSELNKTFERIVAHHPLPTFKGRDIKMFYATQTGIRPPRFMVFCTEPNNVHFTYKRYLINALRESFELYNVPVRIQFKKR